MCVTTTARPSPVLELSCRPSSYCSSPLLLTTIAADLPQPPPTCDSPQFSVAAANRAYRECPSAMARTKGKRSSTGSKGTALSSVFSPDPAAFDASGSPLSDYPDDLSDCSEAQGEKQATLSRILESPSKPPQPQNRTPRRSKLKAGQGLFPTPSPKRTKLSKHETTSPLTLTQVPPEPSGRTLRASQRKASETGFPSPSPKRVKLSKDEATSQAKPRPTRGTKPEDVAQSTPARGGRNKQPSTRFTPRRSIRANSAPGARKAKSLIVRLPYKSPASLARTRQQQITSPDTRSPHTPASHAGERTGHIESTPSHVGPGVKPLLVPRTSKWQAGLDRILEHPTSTGPESTSQEFELDAQNMVDHPSEGSQEQFAQPALEPIAPSSPASIASAEDLEEGATESAILGPRAAEHTKDGSQLNPAFTQPFDLDIGQAIVQSPPTPLQHPPWRKFLHLTWHTILTKI